MYNIPSDSTLHRHCLSEIRSNQAEIFSKFIEAANPHIVTVQTAPVTDCKVWLPLVGFIFVIALFFV